MAADQIGRMKEKYVEQYNMRSNMEKRMIMAESKESRTRELANLCAPVPDPSAEATRAGVCESWR